MKLTAYLPLLSSLFVLAGVNASAQGFYYNVYLDGSYVGTTTDGYPEYGTCGTSISIFSDLNGNSRDLVLPKARRDTGRRGIGPKLEAYG